MIRTLVPAALCLTLGAGLARPAPPALPGPGGVLAAHAGLLAAVDIGEEGVLSGLLAPDRAFRLDLVDDSGRPHTFTDRGEALAALMRWAQEGASAPWRSRTTAERADCHSSDLSYAIVDFERERTVDGHSERRHYRSTALLREEGGHWHVFHWHVSPAETPEGSAKKKHAGAQGAVKGGAR